MQFLGCNSPITCVINEPHRQCALRCCPFICSKTHWWKRCSKPGEIQEKKNPTGTVATPFLGRAGLSVTAAPLQMMLKLRSGVSPLSPPLLARGDGPILLGGLSPPSIPLPLSAAALAAPCPLGDGSGGTDRRDTLAGLPDWLGAGWANHGASPGEGKGVGLWDPACPAMITSPCHTVSVCPQSCSEKLPLVHEEVPKRGLILPHTQPCPAMLPALQEPGGSAE